MAEPLLIVRDLRKRYGGTDAVRDVSFEVARGEIFGILGPNGAGKTSTIEMLAGMRSIDGGEVVLGGVDVTRRPQEVKRRIGVQLQESGFLDKLSLVDLLEMLAAAHGRRIDARALLADVDLADKADSYVETLSGGQRQRFSIAAALVNEPELLFLDEPTTGLDPQARRHLLDLLGGCAPAG